MDEEGENQAREGVNTKQRSNEETETTFWGAFLGWVLLYPIYSLYTLYLICTAE